jgi:hypothetical protein
MSQTIVGSGLFVVKKGARYFLFLVIVSLLLVSCITGGGTTISSADVTATYGAHEFHAQLTAIAQEEASITPTPYLIIYR